MEKPCNYAAFGSLGDFSREVHMNMGRRNSREQIIEKYFVAGAYNLGTPYLNTGTRMELLHLTKETLDKMDLFIYKGQVFITGSEIHGVR